MRDRVKTVKEYQGAFHNASWYDCIMAVADVCDLDNDELAALDADVSFGPSAREFTLTEGKV
jgi:hypothetical protein